MVHTATLLSSSSSPSHLLFTAGLAGTARDGAEGAVAGVSLSDASVDYYT